MPQELPGFDKFVKEDQISILKGIVDLVISTYNSLSVCLFSSI